jgi:predicted nucleic acid-binding protein
MITVDTNLWSLALRRKRLNSPPLAVVTYLNQLIIQKAGVVVLGIVLQEVLSGLRTEAQFDRLKQTLHAFPVMLADETDHLAAAQIMNLCKSKGITVSVADVLIAAMCIHRQAQLLTQDKDFTYIANHTPLKLIAVP